MAAGLSDFSKDIRIVDKLSKLHLQPIRGIVERRLTPAETVGALEYTEEGHILGLTQTLRDCLELRSGLEPTSFPSDIRAIFTSRKNREQNTITGYEPNTNTNKSTRRREKHKYSKAIKIPGLKSHSLFQKYPELVSYRGGPLPIYLYSLTSEENMEWIPRNGETIQNGYNGTLANGVRRRGLGANEDNENANNRFTMIYDTYTLYTAFIPLWTGDIYVYMYWTTDIPEPHLSDYIEYIQNALTMCARPSPLPPLENIPREARQMERLGVRRSLGRLPPEIANLLLAQRGPGSHLARRRKTRKQRK